MVWINQIIFWIPLVLAVLMLLWLWRKMVLGKPVEAGLYRLIILVVVIVFLLQKIGQIILYYFELKNSVLGPYLLPEKGSNYFYTTSLEIAKPFLYALICGSVLALAVYLLERYFRKPWFEKNDIYVFFLAGFLAGFPGIIVLILTTLLLMIIWQLTFQKERVSFAPFLVFTTTVILILNNFSFYQQFLSLIRLN